MSQKDRRSYSAEFKFESVLSTSKEEMVDVDLRFCVTVPKASDRI